MWFKSCVSATPVIVEAVSEVNCKILSVILHINERHQNEQENNDQTASVKASVMMETVGWRNE